MTKPKKAPHVVFEENGPLGLFLTIDGLHHLVVKRVFDLVWAISQERDYYKELADQGGDND